MDKFCHFSTSFYARVRARFAKKAADETKPTGDTETAEKTDETAGESEVAENKESTLTSDEVKKEEEKTEETTEETRNVTRRYAFPLSKLGTVDTNRPTKIDRTWVTVDYGKFYWITDYCKLRCIVVEPLRLRVTVDYGRLRITVHYDIPPFYNS